MPGWAIAGRLVPVKEGTARRHGEGLGFASWVRRERTKKRGTCTTAEFGGEVDASQSGGKPAALHTGSHGNAQRLVSYRYTITYSARLKNCR